MACLGLLRADLSQVLQGTWRRSRTAESASRCNPSCCESLVADPAGSSCPNKLSSPPYVSRRCYYKDLTCLQTHVSCSHISHRIQYFNFALYFSAFEFTSCSSFRGRLVIVAVQKVPSVKLAPRSQVDVSFILLQFADTSDLPPCTARSFVSGIPCVRFPEYSLNV